MLEWTVACSMYLAMPVTNAFLSSKFVSKLACGNWRTGTFGYWKTGPRWLGAQRTHCCQQMPPVLCRKLCPHHPLIPAPTAPHQIPLGHSGLELPTDRTHIRFPSGSLHWALGINAYWHSTHLTAVEKLGRTLLLSSSCKNTHLRVQIHM